jgi:hypothetical protein
VKIHAYQILQSGDIPLDEVFAHINALPLERRLREISGSPLRLETANKTGTSWYLDFTGIRHEGPGRASADSPVSDFDLADTEGFGHETAACFDAASGFMTLQYNHIGPRSSRIRNYLFGFVNEMVDDRGTTRGFGFIPVLKPEAADRLNHMGIVKNIEISFFVPGILSQEASSRQSLSSILDNPLVGSADRIRIQLSASRGRAGSLAVNHVRSIVSELIGIRDDVSELNVLAKETEDSPSEPGPVAGLVGIEGGVVSGVINLESPSV